MIGSTIQRKIKSKHQTKYENRKPIKPLKPNLDKRGEREDDRRRGEKEGGGGWLRRWKEREGAAMMAVPVNELRNVVVRSREEDNGVRTVFLFVQGTEEVEYGRGSHSARQAVTVGQWLAV